VNEPAAKKDGDAGLLDGLSIIGSAGRAVVVPQSTE
jgi:hypothetical protein